ncbi:AsmA-like C-terminal region-containing protein [Limisphaera sp. 4302-co]|uniref:AsmA-like C-terminal region-containing protein n=1 Tax=Limisphaera sp. 4302-co TaxID=3400417 RepID=UPI003C1D08F3
MAGSRWRRWARGCRWAFWACRWFVWVVLLLLLGGLLYLDRVGLPDSLKGPLLDQVRQHGLELEFTRLRLRLGSGIVADQVSVCPSDATNAPRLFADRVRLDLDLAGLWRGRPGVEGLEVVRGRFQFDRGAGEEAGFPWEVEEVRTRIRFLPNDTWRVEDLRARVGPVYCRVSGVLTNATALRGWPGWEGLRRSRSPRGQEGETGAPDWRSWLARTTFTAAPEVVGVFEGDGRAPERLRLWWQMRVPGAATPAGTVHGFRLRLMMTPVPEGTGSRVEAVWEADRVWTSHGDGEQLKAAGVLQFDPSGTWEIHGTCEVAVVTTRWMTGTNGVVEFEVRGGETRAVQQAGWRLRLAAAEADGVFVQGMEGSGHVRRGGADEGPSLQEPWCRAAGWSLDGTVSAETARVRGVGLQKVCCELDWAPPQLRVRRLEAALPSGPVRGELLVEAASGQARFHANSVADPKELEPWLSERTRRWLGQWAWDRPPRMEISGELQLPPWPPQGEAWSRALKERLSLTGEVMLESGGFRGFRAARARSHVQYSNGMWHLPDLEVARPDGWLRADYRVWPWERRYEWRFQFQLPPDAFAPLLHTNQLTWLSLLQWHEPLTAAGEARGAFLRPDTVAGHATVHWTNFVFRELAVQRLEATLAYSNRWLDVLQPRIERAEGRLMADGLAVDFAGQQVHFTNVLCVDDPAAVTAAIGPRTARTLAPYRFERPPRVRLQGTVPWRGRQGADLVAEVEGGPFRWWRFRAEQVTGTVRWRGDSVALTNVTAALCGGQLQGWALFDLSPPDGTAFRFGLQGHGVDLAALMRDVGPAGSRLEGTLDVDLLVDRAHTGDWRTWNGRGAASLRDGWIWSIPLFGVLSEPLDALVPGLGRSRVTSGRATFVLTNGVLVSDDLECRASTMRLQYRGRVSLDGQVEAVVQAELLRDAWLVGRVVSLALWPVSKILEFRITGTLARPTAEPIHIPRVLLIPLRPWQTLRDALGPAPPARGRP